MKLKKIFCLLLVFCLTTTLICCKDGKDENKENNIPSEELTKYDPLDENAEIFKAIYGLQKNEEQGYNYFYYNILKDNKNNRLAYSKGKWIDGNEYIEGKNIHSNGNIVNFEFKSPKTGLAYVSGTIKVVEGKEASFQIVQNNTVVYGNDFAIIDNIKDGYYFELALNINKDDSVYFNVKGNNVTVKLNPTIDFSCSAEKDVHQSLNDDFVGDVHPYYANGQIYLYYLATNGNFDARLRISSDLVNYEEKELITSRLNPIGSAYFVLGVVKEGSVYRSFYGDAKQVSSSKSTDLINWQNGMIFDEDTYEKQYVASSNYPAGIRDPYAFYDPDTNKYHIIANGYKRNQNYEWSNTEGYETHIVLFTSTGSSLATWEKNPVTGNPGYNKALIKLGDWVNDDVGEPECPQMMKIGNRWYIFVSMANRSNSDHGVGRLSYFIGSENTPILEDDWQSKEEHYLSCEDLCAAQVFEMEGKYYTLGWITRYNTSGGWGGTLNLLQEVYQNEDGTLSTKLPEELKTKLNAGRIYTSDKIEFSSASYVEQMATGTYGKSIIDLDIDLSSQTTATGIVVKNGTKTVEIGLRKNGSVYELYLKNQGGDEKVSATYEVTSLENNKANVKIILEGNVAEVFVNDKYSLSCRAGMNLTNNTSIGVFSRGGNTIFNTFNICKLVDANKASDME